MRDNDKSISIRMTEAQHQRLRRYMVLTHLPVTTYFRKLIQEERLRGGGFEMRHSLHTGVSMIHSNVRQIARRQEARELDAKALENLLFLTDTLCEEVFLLTTQK